MLLFKKEEFDRVKSGEITVTFRDWDRIRVEADMDYKSFGLGFVHVEEVGYIDFKKIPDSDLALAGFFDLEEFRTIFRKRNPGFNFGSGRLIRIKFSFLGADNKRAGGIKPAERELIKIMERLVEIDVMSDLELESDKILTMLSGTEAKNTIAISNHFDVSRDELKKRMAQLKKEGLVTAQRNGFLISVRGQTYIDSKI